MASRESEKYFGLTSFWWLLFCCLMGLAFFTVEAVVFGRLWLAICCFLPIAFCTLLAVGEIVEGSDAAKNDRARMIVATACLVFGMLLGMFLFLSFHFWDGFFVCIYALLVPTFVIGFFSGSAGYRKSRERIMVGILYLGVLFATVSFCKYSSYTTQVRANKIIAAVEKFRANKGAYPASLHDLVPRYLERVPPVDLSLTSPNFTIYLGEQSEYLRWNYGYGSKEYFYDFRAKQWKYRYRDL